MTVDTNSLILEQLRLIRKEIADLRTVTLANADRSRRLERRLEEMRDDIELMMKAELMGRLGHFEAQVENRLDAMSDRIGEITHNKA
ncbi:hypothetical protein K6L44_16570 [Gluconacetobacter entanii]|uniref:hypothetical protein n=1 Tax=Gluconacetobacter entanii TaxID=108528 RepID=UPI001C9333CB|nr:hypothetical protein [Gluconacetobacter entanii]MBY4641566.1 hypothetical protein [Gluconacetobacter entanii]MCW4582035.1 hypothetical protein [Gluconacetobacter entanii]MCW4585223.1 hypothetical protein [Gluconacetobacter entanii]MCW4588800.1 hypothetical protein [Gluconacetobacter entanii]